ncbi:MAG: alpha/beta fold hydrolase [Flavobacteriaceae bacterium]|nr:alpha/beta fold hydrolase [Flavobacteriaceae bacterium]
MKIVGASVLILILLLTVGIFQFSKRKSDKKIIKTFQKDSAQVFIKHLNFNDKDIRVLEMQKELDVTLPTLVLVHGSPGAALDFKKYLLDKDLNKKYNIIAYDRIGYSDVAIGEVLNSVADEVEALHEVIKNLDSENMVLLGYSYGATITLASTKNYKKKIILAGAVRGDLEPMFWALNIYKWKLTRPLVPKVFQAASQEKLEHVTELPAYENKWDISEASILSIHGKKDKIVPFENSLFLQEKIDKDKFTLLTIDNGNHSLVWTNFELIKSEILKVK